MAIEADTFRQILSRWASGVTVVTCHGDAGVHGMTASSFCSVSLDPPLVLVCVGRSKYTHRLIEEQRAFGIQILSSEMEGVSDRCAGFRGEAGHWLSDLPWQTARSGAPVLPEALAWMDCRLWQAYDGGDHTIFVGEILAGGAGDGRPLLWFERGYKLIDE